MKKDVWTYREEGQLGYDATSGRDLSGYHVEALDGSIGKIDEATYEVGKSFIIVDTGPWIFHHKVMLPAGVVERVDEDDEKVWVNRTKEQIKDSPEYDVSRISDAGYHDQVGTTTAPVVLRTATSTTTSSPRATARSERSPGAAGAPSRLGTSVADGRRPERVNRGGLDESEPPQDRRRRSCTAPAPRAPAGRASPPRPSAPARGRGSTRDLAPRGASRRLRGTGRPGSDRRAQTRPACRRARRATAARRGAAPLERLPRKSPLTRHPPPCENAIRGKHDLEAGEVVVEGLDSPDLDSVGPMAAPLRAPSRRRPAPTAAPDRASRARADVRATTAARPSSRCSRRCSRCPRRPRISPVAAATAAGSSAIRRWQTPAQRRSEPIVTQYRSSTIRSAPSGGSTWRSGSSASRASAEIIAQAARCRARGRSGPPGRARRRARRRRRPAGTPRP